MRDRDAVTRPDLLHVHFVIPTAGEVPGSPGLALADACTVAPASGRAKMPAAPVTPTDIPTRWLLRKPWADRQEPTGVRFRHGPAFATPRRAALNARSTRHLVMRPDRTDCVCPSDGEFLKVFPIPQALSQTKLPPADCPTALPLYLRELQSRRKIHGPRAWLYRDWRRPRRYSPIPDSKHAAPESAQFLAADQKASPALRGREQWWRGRHLPLAEKMPARNRAAPHEPYSPVIKSDRAMRGRDRLPPEFLSCPELRPRGELFRS